MKTKIGIIQMKPFLGEVEKNITIACEKITKVANEGANIAVLPELFNTGYHLQYLADETVTLGIKYQDETIKKLKECASKNNIYVFATILTEKDAKGIYYNTTIVIDTKGEYIGDYSKTHLFYLEKEYFKVGDSLPVFKTDYGNIGIAICYDIGFPEVARTLTLKGADIILVPSAWRSEDEDMWDLNLPQRALENTCFTVGVNMVLNEKDLNLFGKSMVFNPRGQLVKALPKDKEASEVIEIDLEDVRTYRQKIEYLKDINLDLYKKYL